MASEQRPKHKGWKVKDLPLDWPFRHRLPSLRWIAKVNEASKKPTLDFYDRVRYDKEAL